MGTVSGVSRRNERANARPDTVPIVRYELHRVSFVEPLGSNGQSVEGAVYAANIGSVRAAVANRGCEKFLLWGHIEISETQESND